MSTLLHRCGAPTALALLLLAGCSPVREDRSIGFSGDGKHVAFQNGREGVFVADREGGQPRKIFQPGPNVLAIGTPLWSPTDNRLIFTTAEAATPEARPQRGPAPAEEDPDPAGNVHSERAIVYTCWLRQASRDDPAPDPAPVFRARAAHVGYVAAGLAVRRHPDGRSLLFVDETGPARHGLFEFTFQDGVRRRVFPHDSHALVVDFSPDKVHLACVRRERADTPSAGDGIWVGDPHGGDWWHVPGSQHLAEGELPSILERLRATRPAWAPAGDRFAFASLMQPPAKDRPGRHALCLGTLAGRTVEMLAEGPEPFLDLHWAPDGSRLGAVRGGSKRTLYLGRPGGGKLQPLATRPIRAFAGWDARGTNLAYVVPDALPQAGAADWAFLLIPDPLARDAVYLAPGSGAETGRAVFSGMRVTFPRWAPGETKLSLWATFSPTYRSSLGLLMGASLRRGDPAVVLDPATGALSWKAVNAREEAQVGHYYLLKRDWAEAWRWYERAGKQKPAAAPLTPEEFLRGLADHREATFFEFYCLRKLGREAESRAKLAQFEREFRPRAASSTAGGLAGGEWQRLLVPGLPYTALLRDLYAAEVFLSLDAAADGAQFFSAALAAGGSDQDRLSRAVVLGQLLLIQGKHAEYADLAAKEVAPLLLRVWQPVQVKGDLRGHPQRLLLGLVSLALLPLEAPDFLTGLSDDRVRSLEQRWRELRGQAHDDVTRLSIDRLLAAACRRLGKTAEWQAINRRIHDNPLREEILGGAEAVAVARNRSAFFAIPRLLGQEPR